MTDEDSPTLRVRLTAPGTLPSTEVDAVVRSSSAGKRHDRTFRGLQIAVVPGGDGVELLVPADTGAERIRRLRRLVEFDIAMARRFGAATAGRPAPRTDDRLAELSATLGDDAVRVATRSLVHPGENGAPRPTFG